MRFTQLLGVAVLGLALAGPAMAQSRKETLADIRQELSALGSQLQSLRSELVATGFGGNAAAGGSTLERLDSLEMELQRLTARTEELQHRIDRVVADGTNRIGDLEFRLGELEGGDAGASTQAAPLGGGTSGAPAPRPATGNGKSPPSGTQKAMGEQGDFDRAREVLGQGDFRTAADLFATFAQTYTGGPLTGEAHFYRGEALTGADDTLGAAKAYLESYSGWPQGDKAPEALLKLGQSLAQLGQAQDACLTLEQVGMLYPGSPSAQQAAGSMQSLGCR